MNSSILTFSLKDGCIREDSRDGSDALLLMAKGLSRRGLCVSEARSRRARGRLAIENRGYAEPDVVRRDWSA